MLPALRFLEFLANLPPLDHEPYSDAERAEDEHARQELARGERYTLAEMKRELGFVSPSRSRLSNTIATEPRA